VIFELLAAVAVVKTVQAACSGLHHMARSKRELLVVPLLEEEERQRRVALASAAGEDPEEGLRQIPVKMRVDRIGRRISASDIEVAILDNPSMVDGKTALEVQRLAEARYRARERYLETGEWPPR
jgi:hypothetical protein